MSHPALRRRPHRRSRVAALLLVAALAASSAACVRDESRSGATAGGGGKTTQSNLPDCPLAALDKAEGTVEIDVWYALVGETEIYLKDLAAKFNASQDKVKVNVRSQGQAHAEVLRKYTAGIPSGQLPDIALLEDTTLREVVDTGTLLPAEACEKADGFSTGQLPVVRNYYSANGVYWPGYTNVSEPILYYNAEQFRAAGLDPEEPPETLDEVREVAEALKSEAGVSQPVAQVLNEWFVECWITGAGESVINKGNGRKGLADKATFDNPVTHELYEWLQGMSEDGLLEGYSSTDGQINHYLAVAQKNSAMAIETSTASTTIKAVLGGTEYEGEGVPSADIDGDGIDVMAGPFPGIERPAQVRVSGAAFFMSNTGKPEEQAAAWEFMKYMWSTEAQVGWHVAGSYLPTTQAAASTPEVAEYWEGDLAGRMLKVGYDELVDVDPDNPGPQVGPYTDYRDAIRNSLDRLILKGDSVDDVIADAQQEIQDALTRYIEDNG